jgi:hypothetical protein
MTYDRSDVQPEREYGGEGDGMLSGEFVERLDRGDPDARQQHLDDLIAGAVERGGIIGCSFCRPNSTKRFSFSPLGTRTSARPT